MIVFSSSSSTFPISGMMKYVYNIYIYTHKEICISMTSSICIYDTCAYTGCDAVMVATALMWHPYLFEGLPNHQEHVPTPPGQCLHICYLYLACSLSRSLSVSLILSLSFFLSLALLLSIIYLPILFLSTWYSRTCERWKHFSIHTLS